MDTEEIAPEAVITVQYLFRQFKDMSNNNEKMSAFTGNKFSRAFLYDLEKTLSKNLEEIKELYAF